MCHWIRNYYQLIPSESARFRSLSSILLAKVAGGALARPRMFHPRRFAYWMNFIELKSNFIELKLNFHWIEIKFHWIEFAFSLNWNWIFIELKLNFHWIFIEFSLNWNWIFIEFSLNWIWIFIELKLNFRWIEFEFSLNWIWIFVKLNLNFRWIEIEFHWIEIEVRFWILLKLARHTSKDLTKNFSVLKKYTNKFDYIVYEMFFIHELRPTLNVQSDSIRAKVFN